MSWIAEHIDQIDKNIKERPEWFQALAREVEDRFLSDDVAPVDDETQIRVKT